MCVVIKPTRAGVETSNIYLPKLRARVVHLPRFTMLHFGKENAFPQDPGLLRVADAALGHFVFRHFSTDQSRHRSSLDDLDISGLIYS